MDLQHFFFDHPDSVGESYFSHQRRAFGFGARMVAAGFACLLHGLIPAMFCHTGSRAVTRLYENMVSNRVQSPPQQPGEPGSTRLRLA